MHCIEKSTCDVVGTFRRLPQAFGALIVTRRPGNFVLLPPPSLRPCLQYSWMPWAFAHCVWWLLLRCIPKKYFFPLACNCVAARLVCAYAIVAADTCLEFCELWLAFIVLFGLVFRRGGWLEDLAVNLLPLMSHFFRYWIKMSVCASGR